MKHTQEYLDYLKSDAWKKKRAEKLESVGYVCADADDIRYKPDGTPVQGCSGPLQVHHKTYRNLGHEELWELKVLCEKHHKQTHDHQRVMRSLGERY